MLQDSLKAPEVTPHKTMESSKLRLYEQYCQTANMLKDDSYARYYYMVKQM